MRLPAMAVAAALGLPVSAHAEQVLLKNGGRISGILVERSATHVVLQIGPGQVKLPLASVERVVLGRSALAVFAERAERLASSDKSGWLELGLWARDAGLDTQARECFERVLALDPQNEVAQASLGNVLLDGRWLSQEQAYRARGYVRFECSWMPPEERDEWLRDRAARREEARARAEAEARILEAEARARAAEAAAREAEAAASYGIPVGYGYGYPPYGVAIGGGPIFLGSRHRQTGPYCPLGQTLAPPPRSTQSRDTAGPRSTASRDMSAARWSREAPR